MKRAPSDPTGPLTAGKGRSSARGRSLAWLIAGTCADQDLSRCGDRAIWRFTAEGGPASASGACQGLYPCPCRRCGVCPRARSGQGYRTWRRENDRGSEHPGPPRVQSRADHVSLDARRTYAPDRAGAHPDLAPAPHAATAYDRVDPGPASRPRVDRPPGWSLARLGSLRVGQHRPRPISQAVQQLDKRGALVG